MEWKGSTQIVKHFRKNSLKSLMQSCISFICLQVMLSVPYNYIFTNTVPYSTKYYLGIYQLSKYAIISLRCE